MIAVDAPSQLLVRAVAPWVWRNDAAVARKLEGFAATEAGSALDMLKAAELTDDAKLRRLFFRHAVDEARHAQLFREAATRIRAAGSGARAASDYDVIRATRQNLFERLGLIAFIAFVHLAERRGERQFRALAAHFAGEPELADLFARIGRDERFHVAYSGALLRRWRRELRAREVRRALWRIRWERARDAWRRMGRVLGDGTSRLLLGLLYLVVLPVFALLARRQGGERTGWRRRALPDAADAAGRQF
jgi:rubrerythrin